MRAKVDFYGSRIDCEKKEYLSVVNLFYGEALISVVCYSK